MEQGLLQVARSTAPQGIPIELPDIDSDCSIVKIKRVELEVRQPRTFKMRNRTATQPSSRAEKNTITLDHRTLCTPQATTLASAKSRDVGESVSSGQTKTGQEGPELQALRDALSRRFSSPNPIQASESKFPSKNFISLPPSPRMSRRMGTSRANSVSAGDGKPSRPGSSYANCFGRNRSVTDNSIQPRPPVTPHFKAWMSVTHQQSAYNDPELNPVIIFPEPVPMMPANIHMRNTGFEPRHRVVRRPYRLSDLSVHGDTCDQSSVGLGSSCDGSDVSSDSKGDSSGSCKNRLRTGSSLEEQFKVLQHCRYLRNPINNPL